MNPFEMWVIGLTAHLYRNRRFLIFLVLAVPVVTAAAVHLMNIPEDVRPVLK
jgi:hypothetical protein